MDKNFPRLLELLRLVPAYGQPAASTTEIHRRLRERGIVTSARTVQRDLDALSLEYGFERDERTKPFGWRWPRNARRLSLPDMDWPEALSFRLLDDYLAGLLPDSMAQHLEPYFEQARSKLGRQFLEAPVKRWPGKVKVIVPNQPLVAPTVKASVHSAASEALLADRQLEISYRAIGKALKKHQVHPLGLVLEGNVLYLVVRFFEYSDARTLALHRIEKAVMLEAKAIAPPGFNLDDYIQQGNFGCGSYGRVQLDATWYHYAGDHLTQAKLAPDQRCTTLGEGVVRIQAEVEYTQRLFWWLLGFGSSVVVHGPRRLRADVAAELRRASQCYPTRSSERPK